LSYQGLTLLFEKPADRTNPAPRNFMSMTQHDIWGTWEGKQFNIYIYKVNF